MAGVASLALGIGATLGVNVLFGIGYGIVGAIVAGWPAVALVLASELLMGMIRHNGLSSHAAERDESREIVNGLSWYSAPMISPDEGTHDVGTPVAGGLRSDERNAGPNGSAASTR